ncbi:MAG TPA: 5'-deoxynucleotidase, partial [Clostridiales bacterium]|nr:5'-deoxynucleotidase [Clostridiales bacterium]
MNHFFAWLSRMKHIQRWGLMRNTIPENIQEHSLQVAMIAHALALIQNSRYGGDLDAERICLLAVYHEAHEVITGDLPTPVKYFNPEIKNAYREIEGIASRKLLEMLPDELKIHYTPLLFQQQNDAVLWNCVKAADKISAYLKCREEMKAGNDEFAKAERSIRQEIDAFRMEAV